MTEEEMKAAIEKATGDIESLKAKNLELIAEKRAAKAEAEAALEAAQEAADERNASSTNIEDIKASLAAKHKREMDKLTAERDLALGARDKLLIDNTISGDLVANNVAKQFHPILTAALKAQAKIADGAAMIDGQPLSEYISSFLNGDDGKHYIAAPVNSGAGAVGASKSNATGWTKENFDLTTYMKVAKENPAEANAISASLGLGYEV